VLLPKIEETLSQKTCDEWMEILVEAAVPCGPVNDMAHLFADPQVIHRNMIAEIEHPTIGTLRLGGIPVKYSETPGSVRMHPPLLGEHTDEVLTEVLDYDAQEVAELREQGVVA